MTGGTTKTWEWASQHARINNEYVREAIAEFLGTLLLCFMVVGSGLQSVIMPGVHLEPVFGTIFGLMVSIIIFGGVSGAHINPAVTLGMAIAGELKWAKVPLYIVVQMLGGILGSLLGFWLVKDHLRYGLSIPVDKSIAEWDEANGYAIFNCFTSRPQTFLGIGIVTEIILTTILLMAVLAVMDKRNMAIPKFLLPFMLALTVAALCFAHIVPTGTLLNPVRDMAPRLATLILGWKSETCFLNVNFEGNEQQWWTVGIFGPPIGAALGVFFYIFMVGAQLPLEEEAPNQFQEMQSNYDVNANSGGKTENGDWRHTAFIPRPGSTSPAPPPGNYGAAPTYNPTQQGQQNGNGQFNPGYVRDNRQRQGY